jgi:hypothetical protein
MCDAELDPRCVYCGDVLGPEEPMRLLIAGQAPRLTSRAAEERLPDNAIALHEPCYVQHEMSSH